MSDKRDQIVETAYRLFRAHGYHAVGIDRIIAEAGVAKMTMYRHFRTKDALIVAALAMRRARFEAELDRAIGAGGDADAALDSIVDWYRSWFADADFHGCAFAHALGEFGDPGHPVNRAARAQKDALTARFEHLLRGRLTVPQARDCATALAMLFEGATLQAQLCGADRASAILRDCVRQMVPPATAP